MRGKDSESAPCVQSDFPLAACDAKPVGMLAVLRYPHYAKKNSKTGRGEPRGYFWSEALVDGSSSGRTGIW